MYNVNNLDFVPFQSIGFFQLGGNISQYKDLLSDWEFEPIDEYGKEYYKSSDENLMIAVRNQIIESIFCYKEVLYNNTNLIGLSIQEFKDLLNVEPIGDIEKYDFEDDNYPQFVYEFERIGLQVWEKNGVIVTVIAGSKENYSNEPFYD